MKKMICYEAFTQYVMKYLHKDNKVFTQGILYKINTKSDAYYRGEFIEKYKKNGTMFYKFKNVYWYKKKKKFWKFSYSIIHFRNNQIKKYGVYNG